jgi:hypothetical protein
MLLVRSEYVESLVRELKLLVEYICKIPIIGSRQVFLLPLPHHPASGSAQGGS